MRVGGVALLLSAVALGVAVFGVVRERAQPTKRTPVRTDRVAALEGEVAELKRELARMRAERGARESFRPPMGATAPDDASGGESATAPVIAEDNPELEAIVDDAVDRKTKAAFDELRIKGNKKPPIDAFASVLELTDEQRAVTERVVIDGQRELHAILNTVTADGRNMMDELVEIAAKGMAEPGKDHGWGKWIGRLVSEKVPGTDMTYAARIEGVKAAMRERFKREWTEEQYREYVEWGVDPTEVQNVPGSPNEAIFRRINERARQLGAEIPGDR
jgi:hypothetical protein